MTWSTDCGGAQQPHPAWDAVVVIKPDHIRDLDLIVRWYGARRLIALDDGRGMMETPLYLPEQRALVFADGMTAPGGELRVWASAQHAKRALPALRELLELPFEHVLVSHGEPVHTREAFVAALEREPHSQPEG